MACCGGGGKPVRTQKIDKPQASPPPVKMTRVPKVARTPPAPSTRESRSITSRQYIVPRAACPTCGFPGMVMNVNGKDVMKCSNVDCRKVIG